MMGIIIITVVRWVYSCGGGGKFLVSVHSRLGLFAGTSVYPGRISKSKLSYISSYTREFIILILNLVGL